MNRSLKIGLTLIALLLGVGDLVREAHDSARIEKTTPGQAALAESKLQAKPQLPKPIHPEPQPSQSSRLAEAIELGQPLRLRLPGREPLDFSFRDFPLFTDDYRTTLGQARRLEAGLRVFEGRAVDALGQVHSASLALANHSLAGVVRMADGNTIELRGSEDGRVLALGQAPGQAEFICVNDPRNGESRTMSLDPDLAAADWSGAELASLEPSEEFPALASSGLDPVTGAQTLVLDAPANPPQYEASLKVATVIVALDKSATGRNTTMNLTEVTSQYLALMANLAAIYELSLIHI